MSLTKGIVFGTELKFFQNCPIIYNNAALEKEEDKFSFFRTHRLLEQRSNNINEL